MSRIYFHSPSGAAELRGSERAYMGCMIGDLTAALIPLRWPSDAEKMRRFVPPTHYLSQTGDDRFVESWNTAFRAGGEPIIVIEGEPWDSWRLQLNTVLAIGNDQLRLMARIHAQCEIHGYVEGEHRAWLANIIDGGLSLGVYRGDQGWEAVSALLRARTDEPVVMSYSVCQQFPNADISDWPPPWPAGIEEKWDALSPEQQEARRTERSDAWYELPKHEQWERSMRTLRTKDLMALTPSDFSTYYFGDGRTVFDLAAYLLTSEPSS